MAVGDQQPVAVERETDPGAGVGAYGSVGFPVLNNVDLGQGNGSVSIWALPGDVRALSVRVQKCRFARDSLGKMKTVFSGWAGRHSEKPECVYEDVRAYFAGPRLDMFARRRHEGFDGWGDEVEYG